MGAPALEKPRVARTSAYARRRLQAAVPHVHTTPRRPRPRHLSCIRVVADSVWPRWLSVALLLTVPAGCSRSGSSGVDSAWFNDEAGQRGLDFVHRSSATGRYLMPEIMGGGVALADVDNDGDLDVFLVQSGRLASATGKGPSEERAAPSQLYLNDGSGHFALAVQVDHRETYGMGVAAGDYDNDGDVDFYLTGLGPNALLRNDGRGVFENVTAQAGVADPAWSTAAAFLDLDADGDLDLSVVNYVRWRESMERRCYGHGTQTYCPPQSYNAPAPDSLFRNDGDGTFTDITRTAGLHRAFGNGLGSIAGDFDGDRDIDLFVANDMTVNQLWVNQGGMQFLEDAGYRGCAADENGVAKAGMGVASDDFDDDGDADLLVVNIEGQSDSFFRNEGTWFSDATHAVGLAGPSRRHTRFGVALADFDNDGSLDLYHANGRVEAGKSTTQEGQASPAPDRYAEPNDLFRGTANGRFVRLTNGGTVAELVHTSRGLAVGDVDEDGGLDMVIVNRDSVPYLLMNVVANRGNWARFRALLPSVRDAYGAVVSVGVGERRLTRGIRAEGSYLSASAPRAHFGLANETWAMDVHVRWPDGTEERFGDFPAGKTHTLRQGAGAGPVAVRGSPWSSQKGLDNTQNDSARSITTTHTGTGGGYGGERVSWVRGSWASKLSAAATPDSIAPSMPRSSRAKCSPQNAIRPWRSPIVGTNRDT